MMKYFISGYCLIIFGLLGYFYDQIVRRGEYQEWYLQAGDLAGQLAVGLFILIVLPRIIKGFGVADKLAGVLSEKKFAIGVAMFMTSLLHYMVVKIFPMIQLGRIVPFLPFELMGFLALQITFLWTLVQNEWVNKKFDRFTKYVHPTVYVLVWLLFLHVGLQGLSITSMVLLIVATLDLRLILRRVLKN